MWYIDLIMKHKVNMQRLIAYLLRWQMSTPILAAVTYWLSDYGTILSSIAANLIGGMLFYKIDEKIFSNHKEKTE